MSIKKNRISAFVIDMFIVVFLTVSVCSLSYANPYEDEYQENYEQYTEVYNEMMVSLLENGSVINQEIFYNELIPIMHKLQKYNMFLSIWYLVFYFLYFVIFAYFNNGQTIGKKIFKIRIVDKDENNVSLNKMFIRSLFNGSNLYMGVNVIIILQILILFIKDAGMFYQLYLILNLMSIILEVILVITLLTKKGSRALNDMIAGTKVISLK